MRAHGKIRSMAFTGALLAGAVNMPTLAQDGAVDGAVGDGGGDDGTEIEITRDMVPGGPARRVPGAPPVLSDPAGPEAPRPSLARAAPPSILAILAHPDDELTFAPVLARVAREGGEVTIVFATSGDVGPGVSGMQPGAALAALREGEPVPMLCFPSESFFGQVLRAEALPALMCRQPVMVRCVSEFAMGLRELALIGQGAAWLPRSVIADDLRRGRLRPLPDLGRSVAMDIVVYVATLEGDKGAALAARFEALRDQPTPRRRRTR